MSTATATLVTGVRRRGSQPARGRLDGTDPHRRRRDPATPGRALRRCPRHCCATPIGDGSTAMVYEDSGDGVSEHWRVIDVGTGEVLSEGDVDLSRLRLRRLPGRLDGRGGRGHRRDRHHRRLDRRPAAGIHRPRCRGALAQLLRRRRAAGLRRRRRRGQPVGRHDAGPAGHRVPTPPRGAGPGRRAVHRRHATTWPSRRTTAGSTGGRPTSTGPSTSPARWPGGT